MRLLQLSLLTLLVVAASLTIAAPVIIPAPPEMAANAYVLIDADSGKVLVNHNDEQRLPPASLTKMMTSYVAASELKRARVSLDDQVEVSVKAWKKGGSKMYIREGTKVKLEDLLRGVIIQSGNDASIALAEHIAGSEDAFADVMNQQAVLLNMADTHFVNSTGWPAEDHYTTAKDLALLAVALIMDYPEHYELYSEKYFTYANIRQPNRNKLLWRDPTVDGVKTGHTEAAGFCLVASAKRDGMRLVSVVMGTNSEETRAAESQKLMAYGFRYFETIHLYKAQQAVSKVRVWGGEADTLELGVAEDVIITAPRGTRDSLSANMDIDRVIQAPLTTGQTFGNLTVNLAEAETLEVPIVALKAMQASGFFSRTWDSVVLFFMQLLGMDTLAV